MYKHKLFYLYGRSTFATFIVLETFGLKNGIVGKDKIPIYSFRIIKYV